MRIMEKFYTVDSNKHCICFDNEYNVSVIPHQSFIYFIDSLSQALFHFHIFDTTAVGDCNSDNGFIYMCTAVPKPMKKKMEKNSGPRLCESCDKTHTE